MFIYLLGKGFIKMMWKTDDSEFISTAQIETNFVRCKVKDAFNLETTF